MMLLKKLLIAFAVLYSTTVFQARSQPACTALGQTPATAFPVCGSDTFSQSSVPVCLNGSVPVPGCGGGYQAINPYWYKFTCFASGTLALLISPKDSTDDYDWQLYDITGHSPNDVFTDVNLVVACNWSGVTGNTGTSAGATSYSECGSTSLPASTPPPFSKMPDLVQGHDYLLLISHFSGNSQSGYKLSFTGGSGSITDTTAPALQSAQASCDATQITVGLNKKMQCGSVAADGSDFGLNSPAVTIVAASGNGCSNSFDMDSLTLTLSGPLPVGNYTLSARNGTDGNTLLDNCGAQIPVGNAVPFSIIPVSPTPMDSLTRPGCAPSTLQLVFPKEILCSSIAPDGSDFIVTGTTAVTVSGAGGICDANGASSTILVQLSGPILDAGTYRINLVSGSDGNTIIDICGQETPAGASLGFITKDTVSATFGDQVLYGCKHDTIAFSAPPGNGVDQWQWIFNSTDTSSLEDPVRIYSQFGQQTAQLIVSNGICSDTARTAITLDNAISAAFDGPEILCPKDLAVFVDNSTGNISSWDWDFGDGTGSSFQTPPDHLFPQTGVETKYGVMLIVGNNLGCKDTAVQQVDVQKSCYIAVPGAFTPNGDGVNDYLYPLNAYNADNLEFRVFNRNGQLVFESTNWTSKWDGKVGGQPQPMGTFVWTLQYTDRDTKKKYFLKGTSILIR